MLVPIGTAWSAENIVINSPDISGKTVTIKGTVPASKARIYVEVARKGTELLDRQNVYAAEQTMSDDNGNFSIRFVMPDMDRADSEKAIDGYFTVYASSASFNSADKDFSYIREISRERFFEKLNGANNSKVEMQRILEDEDNRILFDAYSILLGEYDAFPNDVKEVAADCIIENTTVFNEDTISDINETIIAMRLNCINSIDEAKRLLATEDISSRCTLVWEDIAYNTSEDTRKTCFEQRVLAVAQKNGFKKVDDLDVLFDETMAIYNLNNAHYSDAFDIIRNNEDVLSMSECNSYTTIRNLGKNKQENIMKELQKFTKNILAAEDLHKYLDRAYKNYTAKNNSGGGSDGVATNSFVNTIIQPEQNPSENLSQQTVYFDDLDGFDWAKEAINVLAENSVISGNEHGKFNPSANVTRAEFIKMLVAAMGLLDSDVSCAFEDVAENDWSYPYIASAYVNGITTGISETIFGKNNEITRQEAAALMHRSAVRVYIPLEPKQMGDFADGEEIADWAKRSVEIMHNAGYISGVGDNRFEPAAMLTRAQAARMIYGLFEML